MWWGSTPFTRRHGRSRALSQTDPRPGCRLAYPLPSVCPCRHPKPAPPVRPSAPREGGTARRRSAAAAFGRPRPSPHARAALRSACCLARRRLRAQSARGLACVSPRPVTLATTLPPFYDGCNTNLQARASSSSLSTLLSLQSAHAPVRVRAASIATTCVPHTVVFARTRPEAGGGRKKWCARLHACRRAKRARP